MGYKRLRVSRFMLLVGAFCLVLCFVWLVPSGSTQSSPAGRTNGPVIKRLGTIDLDLVETTPVVFRGRLYRFEYVRDRYWDNSTGNSYFRFVDHETRQSTPPFAQGHDLGSAFVEGDTAYVTCVPDWDGERVEMFVSRDLREWERRIVLERPGVGLYNTSLCKADNRYVLMYEVGRPAELAGVRFTAFFAESSNLREWRLLPDDCNYARDRYTAPHCIRYLDGWFYNFYLEAHNGYEQRVVRSRDLRRWEPSPLNPVLRHSPDDKKIANPRLTSVQREKIAKAKNLNNSDMDFCEYEGRLVINYSWGDQHGTEFLAEAIYEGTEDDFLRAWFPR